ncbi:ABC-2 type transport system ATP-binding protein [Azospirillum baldaniorum]|uniref:ABC transporter ATP-binding protein n=1 Tax=Azospirillum baldaniorum TaxID=1064539 RepID=UPI0011A3B812|nr:ABC transporter ATP-binding protein [Azospirillum baldaniorum]TWA59407.1 ABC-2 type transport system ATP-binding protein [Azospirillum baldaniorum]
MVAHAPLNAAALPASTLPTHAVPAYAVEVRGLTKTYQAAGKAGPKQALKGIDLAIPRGAVFGLLGPNGAGKSTLINIMAGLVNKTDGTVSIWGTDIDAHPRQARASIGVVPQELNMDPFFTPREMLELQAGLYGVPKAERRTEELLEAVGLRDKADAYARSLSGGMKRRLMVAKAMVHTPPVLVLDEPTAGVDVELRIQLWEHVRKLNREGSTVLLTTHYLEEAQELCDSIAIINHGTVVACEPTATLLRRVDAKALTVLVDRDLAAVPAELSAFTAELAEPRRLIVRYQPSRQRVDGILAALAGAGLGVVDLSTEESDLEDIFLQLTGGAHARKEIAHDAA